MLFVITEVSATQCKKLVGFGTDGAAANISKNGLKGLIEIEHNWIFCLAHRLELSVRDCLTGTVFDTIDEILLKLYYLYEKSPKKCRELEDLVYIRIGGVYFFYWQRAEANPC